jgi:hypothetical protein
VPTKDLFFQVLFFETLLEIIARWRFLQAQTELGSMLEPQRVK